jgi:hypothetical protein
MSQESSLVGCLLLDNGKIGMVVNEIKSGTWSEDPWFNWTTSYEIKYADGDTCIMTSNSLHRLIETGKIKVLEGGKK